MSRSALLSVAMFVCGALCVLGYSYVTRPARVAPAMPVREAPPSRVTQPPTLDTNETVRAEELQAARNETATRDASAASPDQVSAWIAQATGSDGAKRTAAIAALSGAPRDAAIPVLKQVLETADESDRSLALHSLRTLAQHQGDSDDRIRSIVRSIVYHASDDGSTEAAQATLTAIEADLVAANSRLDR